MAGQKLYYVNLRRAMAYHPSRRLVWRLGVTTEKLEPEPGGGLIQSFPVRATSRDEAVANVVATLSGRLIDLEGDPADPADQVLEVGQGADQASADQGSDTGG